MALDAAQLIFDEKTFLFYCEDDTGKGHLRYVTEIPRTLRQKKQILLLREPLDSPNSGG